MPKDKADLEENSYEMNEGQTSQITALLDRDGYKVPKTEPVEAPDVTNSKEPATPVEESKPEATPKPTEYEKDPTAGMSPTEVEDYFKEHPVIEEEEAVAPVVEEKKQKKEEEKSTDSEKSELDILKEQNTALLAQINTLSETKAPVAETSTAAPVVEPKPVKVELTDDEFSNMQMSKEGFIEGMKKLGLGGVVHNDAVFDGTQVPAIVEAALIKRQFYTENKDLAAIQSYTDMIGLEMAKAHTDWDMGKIMEEAGNKVRINLNLPKPEIAGEKETTKPAKAPSNPAFAPAPSAATASAASSAATKPRLKGEQAEIHKMILYAENR